MIAGTDFKSRFGAWYARESATTNYDVFMRLPALLYFSLGIWAQGSVVAGVVVNDQGLAPALWLTTIAARAAMLAVMVVFAALTLVRSRPVARSEGLGPRITAILGAGAFFGFAFLERAEPALNWELASTLLIASSGILTSLVVLGLGRSFSTMPEARRLVTTGPYALVRHPLYAAEALATIGIVLQFRSGAALALLAAQLALQVRRMNYEEAVLTRAFPEYAAYARSTSRIVPGVF